MISLIVPPIQVLRLRAFCVPLFDSVRGRGVDAIAPTRLGAIGCLCFVLRARGFPSVPFVCSSRLVLGDLVLEFIACVRETKEWRVDFLDAVLSLAKESCWFVAYVLEGGFAV